MSLRSIVTKNILLFVVILLVAVAPLTLRYYQDSRDYEIQALASKLEFFAERGASWIDTPALRKLRRPGDRQSTAYRSLLATLQRIEREFGVDNAVVMRREGDGAYSYIAAGHDGFAVGERVHIHALFPATYRATEDTWQAAEMMHSRLFGGRVGDAEYDQFLQINTPLKVDGDVVAILMLNKFANPVAAAVRLKTVRLGVLSGGLVVAGLALFGFVSSRMLSPLKRLAAVAGEVAGGNLDAELPVARAGDEVGRLTTAFGGMLTGLRQRDFIRDTFGRYVTREVVDELLGSPDGLRLGGETRAVTILVSDLRGFTRFAAGLPPRDVLEILNRYLERMVAVVQRHRGTIDEIQGDGILAFFGAPLAAGDDPVRAVACGVEMQRALDDFNGDQRRLGLSEFGMGIGVHTGDVVVGNIGSERRAKYGAVGTAINIAYRIASETVGGQILASAATYERVRPLVAVRSTVRVEFKGVEEPLTLHEVAGIRGQDQLLLPVRTEEDSLVVVDPAIPVACFAIAGKSVVATPIAGTLVRLGPTAADLVLDTRVARRSDLKIVLAPHGQDGGHELYGKAIQERGGRMRVVFTSVPEGTQSRLDHLLGVASRPAR